MESYVSYEQRLLQNSNLFYTDDLNTTQKNAKEFTSISESMMTEQFIVFKSESAVVQL